MKNQKRVGEMTISEAYPHLLDIATMYGLELKNLKHFKLAKIILVNRYNREL